MIRRFLLFLMAAVMLLGSSSCIREDDNITDNNTITIYLWDISMAKRLTPWLEEQFPEIDFEFIVGYNDINFYTYLQQRGALPDIITNRRFSLNDAADLKDYLLDLSRTELVASFHTTYIENNRDASGSISWLPMCAEIDGIVANKRVFEAYNVPIPTNYAEFTQACRIFEENNIISFYNDYVEDYSCLEAIQGCAIPELMSLNGVQWRTKYESETISGSVGLDDQVWPVVFEKFEQFLKDTYMKPAYLNLSFHAAKDLFLEDKIAMMRCTGADCEIMNAENGMDTVMLPYFGETQEDNWLLTYPIFQVAVNKEVGENPAKKKAVMRVLEAMFSPEGQRMAAIDASVISYNGTSRTELSDSFQWIQSCVDQNHLYQRLASTEIFSISKNVTQKMIQGKYNAQEAYNDFNAQLTTPKNINSADIVASLNTSYDYSFTEHGSQAVSAVVNTLHKEVGTDLFIGYSSIITSSIFAGDYTRQQLKWMLNNRLSIKTAELTGAQIKETMEWLVNEKENGANPIRHSNLIPVTSGMEYSVKDHGDGTYTLISITIGGKELEDDAAYTVALMGFENTIESEFYCNCPMPENIRATLTPLKGNILDFLENALKNGGQMEPPTNYVTILKK